VLLLREPPVLTPGAKCVYVLGADGYRRSYAYSFLFWLR
jgi:hypothetical protein